MSVVSRKNVPLTEVVTMPPLPTVTKIIGARPLALPSDTEDGTIQAPSRWKVNQPQLKELLPTPGGTLGFH